MHTALRGRDTTRGYNLNIANIHVCCFTCKTTAAFRFFMTSQHDMGSQSVRWVWGN